VKMKLIQANTHFMWSLCKCQKKTFCSGGSQTSWVLLW